MAQRELGSKEIEALRYIRNTLIHGARSPSIRDIQNELGYKSPRSAALILDILIENGYLERRTNGTLRLLRDSEEEQDHARTVLVPLVGSAPCGAPLLAEENIEAMIPVSISIAKPGHRYFFLTAKGTSMDRAGIHDGDLVLVRQQVTADSGRIVVALIDDEATIKELRRTPSAVALTPRSSSPEHRPIILTRDFQIQGVVITAIPRSIGDTSR